MNIHVHAHSKNRPFAAHIKEARKVSMNFQNLNDFAQIW